MGGHPFAGGSDLEEIFSAFSGGGVPFAGGFGGPFGAQFTSGGFSGGRRGHSSGFGF